MSSLQYSFEYSSISLISNLFQTFLACLYSFLVTFDPIPRHEANSYLGGRLVFLRSSGLCMASYGYTPFQKIYLKINKVIEFYLFYIVVSKALFSFYHFSHLKALTLKDMGIYDCFLLRVLYSCQEIHTGNLVNL